MEQHCTQFSNLIAKVPLKIHAFSFALQQTSQTCELPSPTSKKAYKYRAEAKKEDKTTFINPSKHSFQHCTYKFSLFNDFIFLSAYA